MQPESSGPGPSVEREDDCMRRAFLILALVVLAVLPALAQGVELRVFQLNNRPALATVEPVRLVLSPSGQVVPDERTETLLVKDTPEALARVEALLQRIDVPAPQVRVTVAFQGAATNRGVQGGAAWNPNNGQVVAGGGAYSNSGSTSGSQNLLVMSGEEARIVVGRDLVQVQPYWTWANQYGLVPPGVIFRQVTTGFVVEPRVGGNEAITLTLTPWFSYDGPGGVGDVRFTEAATSVQLRDGDTVNIGSSSASGDSARGVFGLILGGGVGTSSESGSMTVSAKIQKDWSREP